jgi:DNA-binding response OmpR family regulator
MAKSKKILLVEDDEFILNMYRLKLEMENFEVLVAENGEKAINFFKEKDFDLVLLDIILPKKNGFEVLKEIKELKEKKGTPVILLTNLSQKEDVKKGIKLGADDYLIKSHFLPSEIVAKVKKYLK